MNNMKRLLAVALALVMVLGLCACGEKTPEPTVTPTAEPETAAPTTLPVDEGKTTYIIHVVDANGAPIPNAMVQICLDACYPGPTDETGTAKFSVLEADYKVSFLALPAGYTYSTEEQEFYFEPGSFEMTITLVAE